MSATAPISKAAPSLHSELARSCLPSTNRDPNRKVAWANSVGILFLAIGVLGARRATVHIATPPPIVQPLVEIAEPPPPPVTKLEVNDTHEESKPAESAAPQVVVVVPDSPAIEFSVPTIGTLIAPSSMGQAPPSGNPVAVVAVRNEPAAIQSTGEGGDRPAPPYPQMAKDMGQQGTTVLMITSDANGLVASAEVRQSSGSPILDRSAMDFVKRHWILPRTGAGRKFEAPIHFVLVQ